MLMEAILLQAFHPFEDYRHPRGEDLHIIKERSH